MNPDNQDVDRAPLGSSLRIVAAYAVFASLWILLSDIVLGWLFSDPTTITRFSTIKGWMFVAVTSLLLFGLIKRMHDNLVHTLQTVRHREQQLQDSEGLLHESQRIAGLGTYVLDVSTGIWTTSAICDQVFGIDANYVHNIEGWADLVHPADRQMMTEYFQNEVLLRGQPFDKEYRVVRRNGRAERWLHGRGELEFDAQGRVLKMRGTIQDITDKKRAALDTDAARRRLQTTLDALPDLLFEVGMDGRIYDYHSHRDDLLAAKPEVFLGKLFVEVLPPDVSAVCHQAITEAAEKGFSTGHRYVLQLPQGERWFDLSAAPMRGDDSVDRHFILIARDITQSKVAEEKLLLAGSVFGHAIEGIAITDDEGSFLEVNDAFSRITGYSREEVLGLNPRILKSGRQDPDFYTSMWRDLLENGFWSGEIWNRRKDGKLISDLLTISAVRDARGQPMQYVALYSDITALKEHQNQLEYMAHFDALTKLPNRLLLADRLQQAMNQTQRRGQQMAVAYLDLDGFKSVNDAYGHDTGDQLLIALATHMKDTLREGDTLARLGGDEFVAVLIDLGDAAASVPMLTRLLNAAAQPQLINGHRLQVSASLGVSFYPQPMDLDAEQLLRQADQAMYQAKLAGKSRYHVFDAAQDSNIRGHHEECERVRLALQRDEFVLFYQPKVNMRTGQIIGAEALIRWQHPERGLLAPASFLPLIEDHPLAIDIGEWVIATALSQIAHWRTAGLELPVSVNLGAHQLQQPQFVERLRAILASHASVAPSRLQLEILETSALNDINQVSQVIEACRQIGVTFALDDFGTGYSSLTYLKRLQVAMLKIDQSFVRDMLVDPDDLAILQGVIGLANAFKREVIAEGVETIEHGSLLLKLGCEQAQGYGIARPMPGSALPAWAVEWQPDPTWRGR